MGGSLAGLAAAIFLRESGWQVNVYERSRRPLEGRGAGIVLHPAVFRALARDPAEVSVQATVLRYIDGAGRRASEQPCDYRFISYAALHRELVERFDPEAYHLGSEVAAFEQADGSVELELATGERASGQLLVCADGIRSSARRRLLPNVESAYAGYVGWRGTVAESELSSGAYELFAGALNYCVVPNSHILVYPIPNLDGSLEPGQRLINWVWYRNVEEGAALDDLLTDRHGVRAPVSLGAGQVREEKIVELVAAANRTLPPQLAELVGMSSDPFVQVILDIEVPAMAFGRIVLIGDAAFALRPHVAAGTAKAAEDAWTLARVLERPDGDVPGALGAWADRQLAVGRAVTVRSREVGKRSQFHNTWRLGEPLPFGLYEAGDSLLSAAGEPR